MNLEYNFKLSNIVRMRKLLIFHPHMEGGALKMLHIIKLDEIEGREIGR